MLTKTFPFNGSSVEEIEEQIICYEPDLQLVEKMGYSENCLDLLSRLLEKDPKKRISANFVVGHPFFSKKKHNLDFTNIKDSNFSKSHKNLRR